MESTPVVTLLEKSSVLPATPSNRSSVFLSCLDIFWQHIHYNRRLIFYKTSPQDLSCAVEILKASLSLVLVHFHHWAGRIALGEDHRLVIDCNDLGVEFVEASIDLPISKLEEDDFQMKDYFDSLCQRVEPSNEHLFTSPLLSVQATRFSDGGLAVALAISHVVSDGHSLWHFLVSWGECARGKTLSLEPVHERERLAVQHPSPDKAFLKFEAGEDDAEKTKGCFTVEEEETKRETPEDTLTADAKNPMAEMTEGGTFEVTATENGSVSGTEKPTEHDGTEENGVEVSEPKKDVATVQALFHLSGTNIKKLKSEATASTGKSFSSFVVLCAHFWQRVTIARQRPSSEIAGLGVLLNFRNRLTPPLPPGYFGNVVAFAMASSNAGTVAEESVGAIAARIQEAITASNEERVRGFMNWLELHDNDFTERVRIHGSMISIASSPHFPAYEVDFGWGKPIAVRAVKVTGDGELVLFGGRPGSEGGDVEICTALSSHTIANLRCDQHFLATAPPTSS